jgi:hypothetical protein
MFELQSILPRIVIPTSVHYDSDSVSIQSVLVMRYDAWLQVALDGTVNEIQLFRMSDSVMV